MTGADNPAPASQFYTWIATIMMRTSARNDQQMPYASCNAGIISVLEVEKELQYFCDERTIQAYVTLRPLRVGEYVN